MSDAATATGETAFIRVARRTLVSGHITDDPALVEEFIAIGEDQLRGADTEIRFQSLFARIEDQLDREALSVEARSSLADRPIR